MYKYLVLLTLLLIILLTPIPSSGDSSVDGVSVSYSLEPSYAYNDVYIGAGVTYNITANFTGENNYYYANISVIYNGTVSASFTHHPGGGQGIYITSYGVIVTDISMASSGEHFNVSFNLIVPWYINGSLKIYINITNSTTGKGIVIWRNFTIVNETYIGDVRVPKWLPLHRDIPVSFKVYYKHTHIPVVDEPVWVWLEPASIGSKQSPSKIYTTRSGKDGSVSLIIDGPNTAGIYNLVIETAHLAGNTPYKTTIYIGVALGGEPVNTYYRQAFTAIAMLSLLVGLIIYKKHIG